MGTPVTRLTRIEEEVATWRSLAEHAARVADAWPTMSPEEQTDAARALRHLAAHRPTPAPGCPARVWNGAGAMFVGVQGELDDTPKLRGMLVEAVEVAYGSLLLRERVADRTRQARENPLHLVYRDDGNYWTAARVNA